MNERDRREVEKLMAELDEETLSRVDGLMSPTRYPEAEYWNWQIAKRRRKGLIWSVITGPAAVLMAILAWYLLTDAHYILGGVAVAVTVILALIFHVQFAEARRSDFV